MDEIREKVFKAEVKASRLRKQTRILEKRRKALLAQEKRNIEKLILEKEIGSVAGPGPIGPVVEVSSSEPIVEETIRSPSGLS